MTVLAHIGHWYHAILYLLPVVLVGGGLWFAGRRLPEDDPDGFEEYDDEWDDEPGRPRDDLRADA